MSALPNSLAISLGALADLGVAHWRLETWLADFTADGSKAKLRHVARKIGALLEEAEITVEDPKGHVYDPGLAVEVIEDRDDTMTADDASAVIVETLSPIVRWRKEVIRHGLIVTGRSDESSAGGDPRHREAGS